MCKLSQFGLIELKGNIAIAKDRMNTDEKGDTHSLTTSGITSESLGRRSLAAAQAPFNITFLFSFQNP